jgi:hypothetical protein
MGAVAPETFYAAATRVSKAEDCALPSSDIQGKLYLHAKTKVHVTTRL